MVATPTYVPLAEVTVASDVSSITLPVPSGYRDLVFILQAKTSVEAYPRLQFNGDGSANYSRMGMAVNAGSPAGFFGTVSSISLSGYASSNTNNNYNAIAQILDYSATDKHKTVLARSNNTSNSTDAVATRWANTAAITSIAVLLDTGTYSAGTTINLYGIEA